MGGLDLLHAMRLLMPPAWHGRRRARSGPARVLRVLRAAHGAVGRPGRRRADRRPLRRCARSTATACARRASCITKNRHLTIASEAGVWDYAPEDVVRKGKLGPGDMIALDLQTGTLLEYADIDQLLKTPPSLQGVAASRACATWSRDLVDPRLAAEPMDRDTLALYQKMFNVTPEERDDIIRVLAQDESEAVGSMGDDTPMPVLSHQRALALRLFPPAVRAGHQPADRSAARVDRDVAADADRAGVQRLRAGAGARAPGGARLADPLAAQAAPDPGAAEEVTHEFIDLQYDAARRPARPRSRGCARRPRARCATASSCCCSRTATWSQGTHPDARAARHRRGAPAPGADRAALQVQPARRDRHRARSASLRLPHRLRRHRRVSVHGLPDAVRHDAQGHASSSTSRARLELGRSYRAAIRKGLFKIMSKMGISTIASYRSAQLFEIVGLAREVVELCFTGTDSRIAGRGLRRPRGRHARSSAQRAWNPREPIEQGGLLKYVHGGEYHMYNPDVIAALQAAVISGELRASTGSYAELVNERPPSALRDLLALRARRAADPARRGRAGRSDAGALRLAPACRSARCRPRRTRRWPSR